MSRASPIPGAPARRGLVATAGLVLLSACAAPMSDVRVRHFGSTDLWEGAEMRLFTFDPREPRTLDQRIRLARAEIARDPDCRWADAPTEVIAEATARQGDAFADTLLAAPIICTA